MVNEIISSPVGIISAVVCLSYLLVLADFIFGFFAVRSISHIPKADSARLPSVSVIIAARNEEAEIEKALESVLNLDYPRLEIIVVNDRSDDDTGRILKQMSGKHSGLKIITIESLPAGWLGKNYALHTGAQNASGKYFLFTDADVRFKKDILLRVINYALANKIDHIASIPFVEVPGFWLNSVIAVFGVLFSIYARPWQAKNPNSKRSAGIGAFNFVKAQAYQVSGGFEKVKMRPDDDLMLGRIIKQNGFRQEFMQALDMMTVKWYSSVSEFSRGFYKNSFAGLKYSVTRLMVSVFNTLLFCVFPFAALFFTWGISFILNLLTVSIVFCLYLIMERGSLRRSLYFITYPVTSSMFMFIVFKSSLKTIRRGGIEWRGTFYSLEELKSNKI